MSGHSKWSQIKRDKGANDAKRGAIFLKLSKKITVAVREGGSEDPVHNFKLRIAIDKARQASMPNDNIARAIKKGSGIGEGLSMESVLYEGYGPGGIALLIEGVTDNKNRTVSTIKHTLSKHGGSLGAQGSVAWQFKTRGVILISQESVPSDHDSAVATIIEAGAEDISTSPEGLEVYTAPDNLESVKENLEKDGLKIVFADIVKTPAQSLRITPENTILLESLVMALEENEDITAVHTNREQ